MSGILLESYVPGLSCRRGKVRDVYDLGDRLLLVSTDRISAFDWILPTPIPDKGRLLTQLSNYWFARLDVPHHLLETDVARIDLPPDTNRAALTGRSVLVKKTDVIPFECVVRGYLAGSGWSEYKTKRTVCGAPLPEGLKESDRLSEPLFTPATKAEQGLHDENVSFGTMADSLGQATAKNLRDLSIRLYEQGAARAAEVGLILADTKFEFGWRDGQILLIDEVMTPDSSRYWPLEDYQPGRGQTSFDKQFVRDWLTASDWDKNSPPPELPPDVVQKTRQKYVEAYEKIVGDRFEPSPTH